MACRSIIVRHDTTRGYPPSVSRRFSNWDDIYKGLVDIANSPLAR